MTHDTPPKRITDLISRKAALAIIDHGHGDFHAGNYNGIAALPTVTGYTLTSEAEAMVAAALRDLAQRVALQMEVLSAIHQSWPIRTAGKVDAVLALIPQPASAALDKLIAEAVNEAMLQCIGIVANLRNKRNPGPLFEVLNMAMSDIEDARFAAIREKNNG